MKRAELLKRVAAASEMPVKDVEKTLDALVTVVTDAVGGPKGGGLEKGMKLYSIYQNFLKK